MMKFTTGIIRDSAGAKRMPSNGNIMWTSTAVSKFTQFSNSEGYR